MFKVVILVCAASLTPYTCNSNNAKQVLEGPILDTQHECQWQGHEMLLHSKLYHGDVKAKLWGMSGCWPAKTA